ncbi:hypothetical protein C8034_v011646 [Colletotrichum sidae]|uniref:Uncharacterized protein n=1 Tax=Colletotrichum sidae TaxID=1347389 RepID=A0A4R8TIB5_9PEZI|nr:hypothetical protein C8034_v011646 [Colletotrichum sidae]
MPLRCLGNTSNPLLYQRYRACFSHHLSSQHSQPVFAECLIPIPENPRSPSPASQPPVLSELEPGQTYSKIRVSWPIDARSLVFSFTGGRPSPFAAAANASTVNESRRD